MTINGTYQSKESLFNRIKEQFFSNTEVLNLEKGDVLLNEGKSNDRLFLVLEGSLKGVIEHNEESIELFHCEKDMFVGVYSFFSDSGNSYTTVIAQEPTKLAFISKGQLKRLDLDLVEFHECFLPIIVNELHHRQQDAQRYYEIKEGALKKLVVQEKLAALGQLSAGLAHELNNAVAVLNQKIESFNSRLEMTLKSKGDQYIDLLQKTSTQHSFESSKEKRQQVDYLLKQHKSITRPQAKKLACILSDQQIKDKTIVQNTLGQIDALFEAWSFGRDLHDMKVATDHASHIISSVKTLAAPNRDKEMVDIKFTILKALTLVQHQIKKLDLVTSLELGLETLAGEGDLVQVWVNLIKNAAEAMTNAGTKDPKIEVNLTSENNQIIVTVRDNGPGIPKEKQKSIFAPDYTTKKGGLTFGLGLGLSIVENLVHKYDGTVDLASVPGQTNFTIKLPINHG